MPGLYDVFLQLSLFHAPAMQYLPPLLVGFSFDSATGFFLTFGLAVVSCNESHVKAHNLQTMSHYIVLWSNSSVH